MVSFVLSFFPRDVLDEILNLIESVSEDFPSYSFIPLHFHYQLSMVGILLKRPLSHNYQLICSLRLGNSCVVGHMSACDPMRITLTTQLQTASLSVKRSRRYGCMIRSSYVRLVPSLRPFPPLEGYRFK